MPPASAMLRRRAAGGRGCGCAVAAAMSCRRVASTSNGAARRAMRPTTPAVVLPYYTLPDLRGREVTWNGRRGEAAANTPCARTDDILSRGRRAASQAGRPCLMPRDPRLRAMRRVDCRRCAQRPAMGRTSTSVSCAVFRLYNAASPCQRA
eukprot:363378-Chlamydomonas_euryale.AAC.23